MKRYKFITMGDNIDTDLIISGQYLRSTDFHLWKDHVFESIDPQISKILGPGYVIVAGHNFGCGSSREQAVWAIKNTGISAIVAKSFARIFFRNAINIGLNVIVAPGHNIRDVHAEGEIFLDRENNIIIYEEKKYQIMPYPDFIKEIIRNNGLINFFNNLQSGKR